MDFVAEETPALVALYHVWVAPGRMAFSDEITTVDPGPFLFISGISILEAMKTLLTLTSKRRTNSSVVTSIPDLFGYDHPALCTTIDGAALNFALEVSSWR
jgi:hypothetical protein